MPEFVKRCGGCGARFSASVDFCPNDGTPLEAIGEDKYLGKELLGQFRIEAKIGSGGMGVVYRAHQRNVERKVAIKVLHEDLTRDPDAVRRFQREAQVAASIDHANVVRVLLYGELPDGSGYIAMEFLEGTPLVDVMLAERPLGLGRAIHITTQVCAGVGEAHARGIVHRDIKPENVMLTPRGADPDFVKVLDFGVARVLTGDGSGVTQTGLVFGTARYISPEGASGEATDARSDVYSIGVMLFQMLAGEPPFDGPTPVAVMMQHLQEPAPDVRSRPASRDVPSPIAEVIARAMSKNPEDRFDDARELRAALLRAAALAGIDIPTSSIGMRRATKSSLGDALARASLAPRGDSGTSASDLRVSIPGLQKRSKTSPVARVVLAFVASAAVVFVGFAIRAWVASENAEAATNELVSKAEVALRRSAIDAPPGENAVHYLAELAARDAANPAIARLRNEAVRALCATAETALEQNLLAEARRDFERALAILADYETAKTGLATVTERTRNPDGVESELVRLAPAGARAKSRVTLIAAIDRATVAAMGSDAHFHIVRNRQPVASDLPATWNEVERHYEGTYTFAHGGTFSVVFAVRPSTNQRLSLRGRVVVLNADGSPPSDEAPPRAKRPAPTKAPPTANAPAAGDSITPASPASDTPQEPTVTAPRPTGPAPINWEFPQ
jgi:serine/threonine protein kinase